MPEHMTLEQTRSRREREKKPSNVPPMVGNQYFSVYFGSTLISFARVSNIRSSVEHEDLVEGGLNDHVHVLTKPGTQSGTLTMEKGVSASKSVIELMQALKPGTRIFVPVTITLHHRNEKEWEPVRSWGIDDGIVGSWELSGLDGMGSEVAIEKLEIFHSGLEEL